MVAKGVVIAGRAITATRAAIRAMEVASTAAITFDEVSLFAMLRLNPVQMSLCDGGLA
jgi:hypothetical protein